MPAFERRVTVGVAADTVFELLAEPARLPDWVVGLSLDEAIAVDGDPELQGTGEGAPQAPPARFVADRENRRIEWAAPSGAYAGSVDVQPMLASMSAVIVRLRTEHPVDSAAAERALDQAVGRLQRQLTGS